MRPTLAVFEPVTESSFKFFRCDSASVMGNRHFHDEFELHYLPEFAGNVHVGDYTGLLEPGTIILIAPNLTHGWDLFTPADVPSEPPATSSLVYFSKTMIDRAQILFPELNRLSTLFDDAKLGIMFPPGDEISDIGRSMTILEDLHGCQKISAFFIVLEKLRHCDYQTLSSREDAQNNGGESDEPLNRTLEYINSHYDQSIELESVARIACMSPGHFCRQFKNAYGVSFLTYVNDLRIDRMCTLLEKTTKPISTIVHEIGFSNVSNCNRSFKKRMDMTPTQYRRQHLKNR